MPIPRWFSWEEDRQPAMSRHIITGGQKWFDMTSNPPPAKREEMEVRTEHDFRNSMRMGEVFVTMDQHGQPFSMHLRIEDGYAVD